MKKRLWEIVFIFIISLTPLLWFRPGQIMVGHDNVFPLEPKSFLLNRLTTWTEKQGFGADQSLIMGTIPIHFVDAVPSYLGFDLITGQKLVYVFWFLLMGLSAYLFASIFKKGSPIFRLTSSTLYQFNFFVLQGWFIGERTKFSAYIALPLVMSVFLMVYRQKLGLLKGLALNCLILFCFNGGGIFGIPLFGGLMVVVGLFVIYFSLIGLRDKDYRLSAQLLALAALTVVGFALISAYYILPAASKALGNYSQQLGQMGGKDSLINWARMISVGASPLNLFRLQGLAEWYDNPQHPYSQQYLTNPLLIAISFIWPFLIVLTLLLPKNRSNRRLALYLFLVFLAGVFFAGGAHPPLGFLYVLLMRFVPGFTVFRSPWYKFAPALFFGASLLIAWTSDWLSQRLGKRSLLVFSLLWLALILGYHFPFFTGEFFCWKDNFSTRVAVPQHVFEFGHWATQEKQDNLAILVVPPATRAWNFDLYDWGYLSFYPLPRLLTNQPIFLGNEAKPIGEEEQLLQLAYRSLLDGDQATFAKIASLLQIGYLLVRQDFAADLDWVQTESFVKYQEALEKSFRFPQEKDFGDWLVYKVTPPPPVAKIYAVTDSLLLTDNRFYQDLFDQGVDPTRLAVFDESKEADQFPLASHLLVNCLTCEIEKETGFINFPPVMLLPDSPFYFLVAHQEAKQNRAITAPKQKIYHQMGLLLRHMAELRRMMLDVPYKTDSARLKSVALFQKTFNETEQYFWDHPELVQDRLITEKFRQYLIFQQEELQMCFLQSNMSSDVKENVKELIKHLDTVVSKLQPYLFNHDLAINKLFVFAVPVGANYEISAKLSGAVAASLVIGDQTITPSGASDNGWLDFGQFWLSPGEHQLILQIPPAPDLTTDWQFIEKKFAEGTKNCFSKRIEAFERQADYKVSLRFKNILYENFTYYEDEGLESGTYFFKPNALADLQLRAREADREFLVTPSQEAQFFEIGFCAENLTRQDFDSMMTKIEVKKIISPLLLMKGDHKITPRPTVAFQKISPTKYQVTVSQAAAPFSLIFLQRFSPDWKLSPAVAKNHFAAYSFANGWLIDQVGDFQLTLEYAPQKIFYLGGVVSLITFIACLLVLKFKKGS